MGKASRSGCCVAFGSLLAISTNKSLTLLAFLADVSMCKIPFSSAYAFASANSTLRRPSRSALFPALTWIIKENQQANVMFVSMSQSRPLQSHKIGVSTHHSDDNILIPPSLQFLHPRLRPCKRIRISNIINNNCCCCASVIHWS